MTNKLVVIINSLKVPKIKKILLYETKFLVPNYSRLQKPLTRGLPPQETRSLCPQQNLLNPHPPGTKFLGTPLSNICVLQFIYDQPFSEKWGDLVYASHNQHKTLF